MHLLITRGLEGTAALFAPVAELFDRVYRVAHELSNHDARTGAGVRTRWDERVREMEVLSRQRPDLSEPLDHFVKVSRSYEPGLFHTYDVGTCRAPTTTWSNCSRATGTTSAGAAVGRWRRRAWWCAGRFG